MIISEQQIFELIKWCRGYKNICSQLGWDDHKSEICLLLNKINQQQSEELKEIK